MKKNLVLLCALALLLCTSIITHAQTQARTMVHDGVTRAYRVHPPPVADTCEHLPLVFNLHGSGSAGWQEEFYTSFNNVADTGRFIVVYPDAINAQWGVNGAGVDDVGFIQAMIDTLYAEYRIDRNRVYSCGMSMGGYMSYRLACELTDHIAAIASVAGLLVTFPCNPTRPIPILQIHGTADTTVDYSGVAPTINTWVQKNNCPSTPVVTQLPDVNTHDGTTVTLSYYAPCDDSTEVVLYTVNGGGHSWPDAFINTSITSKDINASNIIWNFLKKYELSTYPAVAHCQWTSVEADIRKTSAFSVRYLSSAELITIETPHNESFEITLFDELGRKLKTFSAVDGKQVSIPFAASTGVYFYVISDKQGVLEKGKMMVY